MKNLRMRCLFEKRGMNLKLKKMKLTLLFSFLIFSSVWAETYSQTTKLSLNLKNATVQNFIKEIEDQTGYLFLYQDEVVDKNRRITIEAKDETLENVLKKFGEQVSVVAEITENQIILKKAPLSLKLPAQQPTRQINGFVSGTDGQPLPGVTVVVKGTTTGTVTNANGEFSLSIPATAETLVFSFVGMRTQEIAIGDRTTFTLAMEEETIGMEEVVVVGYGTQKKSDITGTVASLGKERLEMVPNLNIAQAIQGAMPGVMIHTSSAGADPDQTILVRGRNSITADNDPLIIVDGIPYGGSISDINPNDVQSIEVLKDASAAAIYGSRGANGVILITTQEGVAGKTVFSYDGRYSVTDVTNVSRMLTGPEFYDFKMERNAAAMTQSEVDVYNQGTWVNYADLALRMGETHDHNISFSGGFNNTKYYIGGGVTNIKGVAKNDDFLRLTSRINLETKLTEWLSIGTRTQLTYIDASGTEANFEGAIEKNPLTTAYDENGNLTIYPWDGVITVNNPLQGLLYDDLDRSYQVLSNNYVIVDFPFIDGLSYRLNTGVRMRFTDRGQYRGRDTQSGLASLGNATIRNSISNNTVVENILSYNREIGDHAIFMTGLYSYEGDEAKTNRVDATKFPNDFLSWYAAAQAINVLPENPYSKTSLISQMLRLNYSFDSRYLLTLTVRRDGYSGFGDENKWGTFPSAALGWNLANEDFFPIKDIFNVLKLRASYGLNGNQAIGAYESLSKFIVANYSAGSDALIGYKPSKMGVATLGWEASRTLNFGLDFGIFEGRISGDFNWYFTNTQDLLLDRSISVIHGITPATHLPKWIHPAVTSNIGETQNSGIEVVINSRNIVSDKFHWSTTGNFSFNQNKIVSLYGVKDDSGNEIDDVSNKWFIGQPIRVNYDYVWDGVWQLDEAEEAAKYGSKPGWAKLKDFDGDGLNADDRRIIGQIDPKLLWGLTNTFSYNNFTLSIFMHGVHGATVMNYLMNDNVQGAEVRFNTLKKNWWTPDNPTNDWVKNEELATQMEGNSAHIYENPDYVRIKDVSLSYDMPQSLIGKLGLTRLRLYVTGRNLLTFTKWTGMDPELVDEDSQQEIPMQKEYVIGLSMGF